MIGRVTGRQIDAEALLDSGAEGIIINRGFVDRLKMKTKKLERPFPVTNVDGTENSMGWVREVTTQRIRIYSKHSSSYHEEEAEFFIADIGDHDMILGTDWLEEHNPTIDWQQHRVDMTRCPPHCTVSEPPVLNLDTKPRRTSIAPPPRKVQATETRRTSLPQDDPFPEPTYVSWTPIPKYVTPAR